MREAELNRLLRRVDWRFLLDRAERPRALDFASGVLSEATGLVSSRSPRDSDGADLVVLDRPTRTRIMAAAKRLRPGGELYCEWRLPTPGGTRRAKGVLERAGFTDIRLLWPWPAPPLGRPQLWLPIGSPEAVRTFVSLRPAATKRRQAVARALWPAAARGGLLAPICVIARRPDAPGGRGRARDELARLLAAPTDGADPAPAWVLLTGGQRSISKVVGLRFFPQGSVPELVVKFARVPEADASLEHEAHVLSTLAAERASLPGVPRVLAAGHRAGRVAVAESAIHGVSLLSQLTAETFPDLAERVTSWLIQLANVNMPDPHRDWQRSVVARSLEEFERDFRGVVDTATIECARARLERVGPLRPSFEHRDCAPWNLILTGDRTPAVLDWESAEPRGLPALDLVYFLANAAFLLEGTLGTGRARETYVRLLDPTTAIGSVAAESFAVYCAGVGIEPAVLAGLRMLCWVVHAHSEHARARSDGGGVPSRDTLRASTFLGLIHEELRRGR